MGKKVKYYDKFYCFDIETTHEKINGIDVVYTWHWSIMDSEKNYHVCISWPDFWRYLDSLCDGSNAHMIIYVHNLGYEFEAIARNLCNHYITDMFSLDTHVPVYVIIDDWIEFRCSYKLTNKSLAECGRDVGLPKLEMNYADIVKPGDALPPEKEAYTRRDVEIMVAKIHQLEVQEGKGFQKFPLTNTGFLRDEMRVIMRNNKKWMYNFHRGALDYKKYVLCKNAFMGGYVHANYRYMGKVISDVHSFDFGSAYPFDVACCKVPVGFMQWLENPTYKKACGLIKRGMMWIAKIQFTGVRARGDNTFLSAAKCLFSEKTQLDNGRIYYAEKFVVCLTCLDFITMCRCYHIDSVKFIELLYGSCDYMPSDFVQCMMKYYEAKQKLKGVKGQEINYMKSKNRVNSFYGMMVQDPVNDVIEFNALEWKHKPIDRLNEKEVTECLNTYYSSKRSFLMFQIGIFIPAWTRFFLWGIIKQINHNVIYSDTDSLKVFHWKQCIYAIINYNKKAREMVRKMRERNNIDYPCADLGVMDWETKEKAYAGFKTLGAKKYCVLTDSGYQLTVAGLSKKAGKYIKSFNDFTSGTIFAAGVSGRTVVHPTTNSVETYDNGASWIEDTTYTLTISHDYAEFSGLHDASQLIIYPDRREVRPWEDVQKGLKYRIDEKRTTLLILDKLRKVVNND